MREHVCAEVTYSALELGAGETQTTCGEDRLTPLLLLHHREAVPVSPADMHPVSRQHVCFSLFSTSGNKGGDHRPSFVQKVQNSYMQVLLAESSGQWW